MATTNGNNADNEQKPWLGFDLGGSKMLAVVLNEKFESLGRKRRKTRAHEGSESVLDRIFETIRQACEDAKVEPSELAGIGIGCPGPLDLDRGVVIEAPNLGWQKVKLKSLLEKEFGCSAVIGNDVDLGVYGEYRFGAAKKARCVVGVFPGTGIGGGCVYQGDIFRGSVHSCMEIGHNQMIPSGPLGGFGKEGSLEAIAGRLAIAADAVQAAHRGQAPHLLERCGTDISNIRSGAIAASIEAGDEAVKQIVLRAARYIGIAIANVVNLLAPDVVVLGGGLVEALGDLFVKEIERAARDHVIPGFRDIFKVVEAKLGDDACVLGAAGWARHCIEENNTAAAVAEKV